MIYLHLFACLVAPALYLLIYKLTGSIVLFGCAEVGIGALIWLFGVYAAWRDFEK